MYKRLVIFHRCYDEGFCSNVILLRYVSVFSLKYLRHLPQALFTKLGVVGGKPQRTVWSLAKTWEGCEAPQKTNVQPSYLRKRCQSHTYLRNHKGQSGAWLRPGRAVKLLKAGSISPTPQLCVQVYSGS